MKIIAKTKDSYSKAFLVEMTDDEIAKLLGYTYSSSLPVGYDLEIGKQFNVSQAWQDLAQFKQAEKRIKEASEILKSIANLAEVTTANYMISQETT